MKNSTLPLLVLLFIFSNACLGKDCTSSLPLAARRIVSEFHGWRIVKLADLPLDDQKLWAASHDGSCPGVASGNFTSDITRSFAVALIRRRPGRFLEQVIMLAAEGGSFRRTAVTKPISVVSPFVIWKLPPGKYKEVDQGETVQIIRNSFVYEKIEAYATQFYYVDGRLRSIVTAN